MNKTLIDIRRGVIFGVMGCALAATANADTVLLEQSGLISGQQSFVFEMNAPGAGTMTVRLSNLAWPERLSSLSFAASTATGVLQSLSEPGVLTFAIDGPGAYYAHVAGTAQGALDLGLYSLNISFDALASPVPLPGAAWLLLSGIALVAGRFRKESVMHHA